MLRIDCPVCGLRDETEFAYAGDATRTRPPMAETDPAVWHDYVFLRDNPRGPHLEYWHHVQGCRQVLVVARDTLTHAIGAVRLAREAPAAETPAADAPPRGPSAAPGGRA